ncbi:MAG TPA: roadblock/LC7 domain-containing protein [Nitrospiria bacterium]|jgi:predicted regulator of Ras-like GTPase activity (Roadblock/LC7/MglB family)
MSFEESLRRITNNMEDSMGVALVGMDGIVVEEHKRDPLLDLHSLGAEYCSVIKGLEKTSDSLSMGVMRELSVVAEKSTVLLKRINDEYFLLLVVGSDGNFGKGRFLMKKELYHLEKEL